MYERNGTKKVTVFTVQDNGRVSVSIGIGGIMAGTVTSTDGFLNDFLGYVSRYAVGVAHGNPARSGSLQRPLSLSLYRLEPGMVENIVNICSLLSIGLEHSADQVLGNCREKN